MCINPHCHIVTSNGTLIFQNWDFVNTCVKQMTRSLILIAAVVNNHLNDHPGFEPGTFGRLAYRRSRPTELMITRLDCWIDLTMELEKWYFWVRAFHLQQWSRRVCNDRFKTLAISNWLRRTTWLCVDDFIIYLIIMNNIIPEQLYAERAASIAWSVLNKLVCNPRLHAITQRVLAQQKIVQKWCHGLQITYSSVFPANIV